MTCPPCPYGISCAMQRGKVLEYFARSSPCLIGIKACGGAHCWARALSKLGHTVKLIAQ